MFRPRSTSAGGWAGAEVTERLILFIDKIIQDSLNIGHEKDKIGLGLKRIPDLNNWGIWSFSCQSTWEMFHLEYLSSIDSEKYEVDVGNRLL